MGQGVSGFAGLKCVQTMHIRFAVSATQFGSMDSSSDALPPPHTTEDGNTDIRNTN